MGSLNSDGSHLNQNRKSTRSTGASQSFSADRVEVTGVKLDKVNFGTNSDPIISQINVVSNVETIKTTSSNKDTVVRRVHDTSSASPIDGLNNPNVWTVSSGAGGSQNLAQVLARGERASTHNLLDVGKFLTFAGDGQDGTVNFYTSGNYVFYTSAQNLQHGDVTDFVGTNTFQIHSSPNYVWTAAPKHFLGPIGNSYIAGDFPATDNLTIYADSSIFLRNNTSVTGSLNVSSDLTVHGRVGAVYNIQNVAWRVGRDNIFYQFDTFNNTGAVNTSTGVLPQNNSDISGDGNRVNFIVTSNKGIKIIPSGGDLINVSSLSTSNFIISSGVGSAITLQNIGSTWYAVSMMGTWTVA